MRILGPDPAPSDVEAPRTMEASKRIALSVENDYEAVAANAALDVARDAWLEGRDHRDLLAQVPNPRDPETGLRVHDLWEWERIFEAEDERARKRTSAWLKTHGQEDE